MSDQPNDRELAWRVWSMAWPTVLHGLLESSMGVVDLLMVRPLGPDATAAVGIGRQVTFLVAAAAIAVSGIRVRGESSARVDVMHMLYQQYSRQTSRLT